MKFLSKTGSAHKWFLYLPFSCYKGTFLQTVTLILGKQFLSWKFYSDHCAFACQTMTFPPSINPETLGMQRDIKECLVLSMDHGVSPHWIRVPRSLQFTCNSSNYLSITVMCLFICCLSSLHAVFTRMEMSLTCHAAIVGGERSKNHPYYTEITST